MSAIESGNDFPLRIVTAASHNHYHCLKNLLFSLYLFEKKTPTFIYDIGLKPEEARELKNSGYTLRRFPFEKYPPHVDIRVARGQYAWKPIIVADLLVEFGGSVLWLDAGNIVRRPLRGVRKVLSQFGIYSPLSPGTVSKWTHPGTLKYLAASDGLLAKRNRNGAVVGLRSGHPGCDELAQAWKRCALDPACIAPVGSSRDNHRQDQAVLTVLMYQWQQANAWPPLLDELIDIGIHKDWLSRREVRRELGLRFFSGLCFPLS